MKAAMVEKPGVLMVCDVPKPVPGPYGILCEMQYASTCTGTDMHILHGNMPWPISYPAILGHESVGRAVQLGPKVRHVEIGELITRVAAPPAEDGSYGVVWGGYAEFGIAKDWRAMRDDGLPQEQWDAFRVNEVVPPGIDAAAAPMIITWRETLSYLTRMGVGKGHAVLVIGSGGNGLSFVSHARNRGAETIVMIGNKQRREAGLAAGASAYFDYRTPDIGQVIKEELPQGYDFIIDAVGKRDQINRVLQRLKPGGTLGVYGIDDYYFASINPRLARGSFKYYNDGYDEEEAHDRVIGFIKDNVLNPSIWLDMDRVFALKDIKAALDAARDREVVKALIRLA